MPLVSPSPGCVLQFLAPSSPEEPAVPSERQLQPDPTPGEQLEVYPESGTWDLVMAGIGTALLGGGILMLLLMVSAAGGRRGAAQPMPQCGSRPRCISWFVLQKLQRQHAAQQQQLEEQIQFLQQQQEMLRPGRVSREGIPEEPRELELSQGSAAELSQSSSPSACLKDLANGTLSPEPAVPAAAEGGCRGNGQALGASVQSASTQSRCRDAHR